MKKISLILSLLLANSFLTSCNNIITDDYITIYNWEDYIDEGIDENGYFNEDSTSVLDDFKNWYYQTYNRTITVNYATFSTNEDIYNQLKLGTIKADVICPSDYMIQKMAKENMLETFNYENHSYLDIPNYNKYASPYIKDLFEKNDLSRYSIPYTWGTMGFNINTNYLNPEQMSSWSIMWDSSLKGKISVKDSVRDTYFTAVMYIYKDELDALKNKFDKKEISEEEYNNDLSEIFNRVDDVTLEKAKNALFDLKKNIYGLEVDDGRTEIIKGTYYASLCWSGEAVYSMDLADEGNINGQQVELNYVIPEEGSNIWFDGWVMPKGANKNVAAAFLDFLSLPSVAAKNMNYTGYTSSIAGDEILDLAKEWYDEGEEGTNKVDLSYFFNGTISDDRSPIFSISERNRQFDAQYPSEETISRCAIMKDFGSQTDKLNQMWADFKAE